MKLSIIMPCYNRLEFLKRTLWSFYHNINMKDYEVVVVDDFSDYSMRADLAAEEFGDKLNLKIILRTKKISRNAGIPFNQAASEAEGDILLITGPDFILMDSLDGALDNFSKDSNKMVAASTYALSRIDQDFIEKTDFSNRSVFKEIKEKIEFLPKGILKEGEEGWYCHPRYRPFGIGTPWLISKKNFDGLGGFDEDFYRYFGFEDTDFLRRVTQNLSLEVVEDELFIHQYHYKAGDSEDIKNRESGYRQNRVIYERKLRQG